MDITILHHGELPIPPVLGGAVEQIIYETVLGLASPQISVVSQWHEALGGVELPADVAGRIHYANPRPGTVRLDRGIGRRQPAELQLRRLRYLHGAVPLLSQLGSPVIQVENRPEFVPRLRDHFADRCLVLSMHNEPDLPAVLLERALDSSDHLVFVSRYLADRFAARRPDCRSRSTVIHNAVDVGVWHPDLRNAPQTRSLRERYGLREGRTILFVGRISPEKGIDRLLDAFALVHHFLPDTRLVVVGSPMFDAVREDDYSRWIKARASGLADAVVFTGYVEPALIPHYFAAADLTVVPSLWGEPFGKVVIESMAVGVPVIGSRRGAIPEIITHERDGMLVDEPEDASVLAHRIIERLENDTWRKEAGRASRQTVIDRFASPTRLSRVREFYAEILEDGSAGPRAQNKSCESSHEPQLTGETQ